MTELEHSTIYNKHNDILHTLDKKIDILINDNINTTEKLASLEKRFDIFAGTQSGDFHDIRQLLTNEINKFEMKIENNFANVNRRVDKCEDNINEINRFKSEVNGKIYGLVLGVGAVFAVVSFLITKFV